MDRRSHGEGGGEGKAMEEVVAAQFGTKPKKP